MGFIAPPMAIKYIRKGEKMQAKYRNIKAEYNGEIYDSRKEMRRAYALDMLVRCGRIKDLERQKRFILQDGYMTRDGRKIRPISYIADFVYYDNDKRSWVVEDVKGVRTDVYRLKRKMFEFRYPEYLFLES